MPLWRYDVYMNSIIYSWRYIRMEYIFGCVIGVIVGIILVAFILKITKNDGTIKCKYDERQQFIQGKGFKYAFFTLVVYNLFYALVDSFLQREYIENSCAMFLGVVLGVAVYAGYCIKHEGYFSLNENPKRVIIAFAVIGIVNILISVVHIMHGRLIQNGVLQFEAINLICGILFIVILIEIGIKRRFNRKEAD